MNRRLAIVSHYWAPHVGGVETIAREQAHRLAALGWQVEVFTTRLGPDPATSTEGGLRIHRYRCVNWQERSLRLPVPLPSPRMLAALVRYARGGGAVLAHSHSYPSSGYAAQAARITGRPLVVVQSNPFVDYPFPLAAVERTADRTAGRWVLHQARAVVCVSRFVESYVRRIAPRARTSVIYSGVDTGRFSPDGAPPAGTGPRPDGLHVLTVRRLVPRNGVDVLVEAWRRAAPGPAARLTIAGDGPEAGRLRRLAAGMPSVRFPGYVPDDGLPGLYRSADVVAVPSVSGEGFGLVAAEALSSGVPVIATTGGATGELVRHGSDGLIAGAGDPDALAAAITRFAREPGLLASMTAAARARRPGLGWDDSIQRLAGTLAGVLADPVPTRPAPAGATPNGAGQ